LTVVVQATASVALGAARFVRRRLAPLVLVADPLPLLVELGNAVAAAASNDDEREHCENECDRGADTPLATRSKCGPAG
jgi:hypothetical protein